MEALMIALPALLGVAALVGAIHFGGRARTAARGPRGAYWVLTALLGIVAFGIGSCYVLLLSVPLK